MVGSHPAWHDGGGRRHRQGGSRHVLSFRAPEYERLRLAFEWNQFPHHKPEDICKRVAENTLELQEACRNAIEELVETLPVEDDRSVLILTQFQNIDLLRRKLRGNSRAVDILLRMKNSTAESLVREDQYYAEMVCTCARRFLECEGDRSNFLLFALFDTPWKLYEDVEWVVEVNQAVENSDFAPYYFQYRLFKRVSESMSLREIATLPTSMLARIVADYDLSVAVEDEDVFMSMYEKLKRVDCQSHIFRIHPKLMRDEDFLFAVFSTSTLRRCSGIGRQRTCIVRRASLSASLTHRHTAREKRSRVWPCPEIQSACGKNIHRTCCKRYARNRRLSAASQDIWN